MAESTKQIVLLTGGNTGIGYETAKALLSSSEHSYHILLSSRSLSNAETAISELQSQYTDTTSSLEALQLDVTSDDSINAAFEKVKEGYGRVDVLINNAGASFDGDMIKKKVSMREGWNSAYDVNVTGTQILTHTFAPLLLSSASPRLLFVTSGLSSLTNMNTTTGPAARPPPPAGWPKPVGASLAAYRSSKTALNMMMAEWSRLLKEDGVKVWAISPGFLATGLGGDKELLKRMGAGEPRIGGELIKKVVEGERDADVGKVVNGQGVQPW